MSEKMTNVSAINYVLENCDDLPTDVKEKLNNILTSFNKRSTRKKSEEEIALHNEAKKQIIEILSRADVQLTYVDFQITDYFKGYSTPKITRLLIDMANEGILVRTFVKKKAFYKINDEQ